MIKLGVEVMVYFLIPHSIFCGKVGQIAIFSNGQPSDLEDTHQEQPYFSIPDFVIAHGTAAPPVFS